jgi:hypothetical protein
MTLTTFSNPMKKNIFFLTFLLIFQSFSSFSNHELEPVKDVQVFQFQPVVDNPKGKLKIRFVSTIDKSDTTNRQKGFFAKIKNVFNALMDASDNPPFKIEVVREKGKKN